MIRKTNVPLGRGSRMVLWWSSHNFQMTEKKQSLDIPALSPEAQELQLEIANLLRLVQDAKNVRDITGIKDYDSPLDESNYQKRYNGQWAQDLLLSRLDMVSEASVISKAKSRWRRHGYNSTMNIAADFLDRSDAKGLEKEVRLCATKIRRTRLNI